MFDEAVERVGAERDDAAWAETLHFADGSADLSFGQMIALCLVQQFIGHLDGKRGHLCVVGPGQSFPPAGTFKRPTDARGIC